MLVKLLPHMVGFRTPLPESVFGHCIAPHSGFYIKALHREIDHPYPRYHSNYTRPKLARLNRTDPAPG
jgi:hypothetical protein